MFLNVLLTFFLSGLVAFFCFDFLVSGFFFFCVCNCSIKQVPRNVQKQVQMGLEGNPMQSLKVCGLDVELF